MIRKISLALALLITLIPPIQGCSPITKETLPASLAETLDSDNPAAGTSDGHSVESSDDFSSAPSAGDAGSFGDSVKAGTLPSPEQDYYEYINRSLLNSKEIPADSGSWSYFYELSEKAYEDLDAILKETVADRKKYAAGSDGQRIAGLYLTAMDSGTRNRAGLGSLSNYLDNIRSAKDIPEYLSAVAALSHDFGYSDLLSIGYDIDMIDSSRYACYIGTGDLGLGKETFQDSTQSALHQTYRTYMASMLEQSGMQKVEASQASSEIFSMMKALAAASLSLSETSDPSQIYHRYTAADLNTLIPNADIKSFLNKSGAGAFETYIVMQPDYLRKVNEYLTPDHLPLLKNYSVFCVMNDFGSYLDLDTRTILLRFRQSLQGTKAIKSDEKLAGQMTQKLLEFEFGRLYAERCFSEEDKQKATALIKRVLDAYEEKIDALDWMSTETKTAAKKKLKCMNLKIGYPEQWPDSHDQAVILAPEDGGILIDNVLELKKSSAAYERRLARGPVDGTRWYMSPQTANAYYSPMANEIVFPAAILQPPFFDPSAADAENLGGIGMVAAHEITHAFDDSGSQYDENGNYHVWWTPEDYANFSARTQAVVEYYEGYEGFDGIMVNGKQTLGENIADLGAVSCVMQIVGDDPEALRTLCSRFARIWAAKYTDESMKMRLNTDVHSPAKVRVNAVLSSMDGFYLAYPQVKEGDGMYVAPQKRVKVW